MNMERIIGLLDQWIIGVGAGRHLSNNPLKLMPAKKINVAVAGLGFMGVTHLRVYQKIRNARIVAVCDAVRLPIKGVLRGVNGNIQKSNDIHLGAGVKVYREFNEL